MRKAALVFLLLIIIALPVKKSLAQTRASSLPVLVSVTAKLTGSNKVAVSWTVLQKVNTDCFDVEKSNDGISWHTIATVKANNDTVVPFTYTVIDMSPLRGSNFYQVRIKDFSGNFSFTLIKDVQVTAAGKIGLYPNPAFNQVNISLSQLFRTDWSIAVFNSQGQVMTRKQYNKNITMASLPVALYPAGYYTVEITGGNYRQSNALLINHN